MTPLDAIRRYPLFALACPDTVKSWLAVSQHVAYRFGETLFQIGSNGEWVYLILKGRVRVLRKVEGKEATLSILQAGQLFGEYALVSPGRNTATCRAASDIDVLQIPLRLLQNWLDKRLAGNSFPKSWMQLNQLISHLRELPYQGFMSQGSALAMLPHLRELEVEPLRTLQAPGLCDDWWIYLQEGEVQVDSPSGFRDIGPGDFLGERAMVGELIPTAVTRTKVRCLGLPRSFFVRPGQSATNVEQSHVAHTLSQPERVRWVGQREASDCGAAALAMIAQYYDRNYALEEIRNRLTIGHNGVSALELVEAAKHFGLQAEAVRVSPHQMLHAQMPALVHMDHCHYSALFRLSDRGAYLGDPATGLITVAFLSFAKRCSGRMILLRPKK